MSNATGARLVIGKGEKKMKRSCLFFLIITLIISGCTHISSSINRNFKGESDHWTGLYQVIGNDLNHESTHKLIYTGSDLSTVGKVKYSFKSAGSSLVDLNGEDFLVKDKDYLMGNSDGNGAVIPADNTIEVVVEWNDQIEKFSLNPVKEPVQM